MSKKTLFFIALLPPPPISEYATGIKHYLAERYHSRHALKSPPHITLQPPFKWESERLDELQRSLSSFAQSYHSISITLHGFSAFPPRVIYINVNRTQPLLTLHGALIEHLEATIGLIDPKEKSRPYAPHMTVAFRDLTKQNFKLAWDEFKQASLLFEFAASSLALLVHTGQRWEVHQEFPFSMVNR